MILDGEEVEFILVFAWEVEVEVDEFGVVYVRIADGLQFTLLLH